MPESRFSTQTIQDLYSPTLIFIRAHVYRENITATLHPVHPVQPLFWGKIKAIVFFKKMMARKKKMTAFKKNAVVFQSKRGRVLKKRHSAWKNLPKVKGVKGENTTLYVKSHNKPFAPPHTEPHKKVHGIFGLYYKLNYICNIKSGKQR